MERCVSTGRADILPHGAESGAGLGGGQRRDQGQGGRGDRRLQDQADPQGESQYNVFVDLMLTGLVVRGAGRWAARLQEVRPGECGRVRDHPLLRPGRVQRSAAGGPGRGDHSPAHGGLPQTQCWRDFGQ